MTLTSVNPLQLESGVNVRDLNLVTNCRGAVPVEKQNKKTTKMAIYSIKKQRARTFFFLIITLHQFHNDFGSNP